MNKSALAIDAAIFLATFMAMVDLLSAPSSSLLAANSTMVLVLITMSVVLLAILTRRSTGGRTEQAADRTRGTPVNEMAELLKGASKGYTWNRKEIALTLKSAVNAKIGHDADHLAHETADAYLRSVLGSQTFEEFFSEDGWRATRVAGSYGYLTRLKAAVASLTQALGF